MTTNASQLEDKAEALALAGMKRINISLDSLEPETFARVTRGGDLTRTLAGIEAAKAAGLKVKINMVALKNDNASELPAMIEWAHAGGMDVSLIEIMPLGETGENRRDQYISLEAIRAELTLYWDLLPTTTQSAGPSRYVHIPQTGGKLGFITPMSQNFCDSCNRVRVSCTGQLYLCLGHENKVDLRILLRQNPLEPENLRIEKLQTAIQKALEQKPLRHDFVAQADGRQPRLSRHMSLTGG